MAGYKTWADLDILTASDLNGYLMQQAVPRFATMAALTAAITAPTAGMLAWVTGYGLLEYTGSAWGPRTNLVGGVRIEQAADLATITGSTETNVASLAITGKQVWNGWMYRLAGAIHVRPTVNGDAWTLRLRTGTALTGTQIATSQIISKATSFDDHHVFSFAWRCTADNATQAFYLSYQRASGTGNLVIAGNGDTHWSVETIGLGSQWTLV